METAPSMDTINVIPDGYATTILNSKGKTIQTLVGKEANRQYATLDTIPKHLQNAFVAIEDERFWVHDGIDLQGIFRATFSGLSNGGEFHQGASTLTQQLLKNQVFNGGEETTFAQKLERKVQEQYLAIQLENRLTKEQILEYYLNTINLGQNTLGVQAAAKRCIGTYHLGIRRARWNYAEPRRLQSDYTSKTKCQKTDNHSFLYERSGIYHFR